MIEQKDAERLGTPGEDDGEFLVGAAWGGVAGGMIVDDEEAICVEFEGALENGARIERGIGWRARSQQVVPDQFVARVEIQDADRFDAVVRCCQRQISAQLVAIGGHGPTPDAVEQHEAEGCADRMQMCGGGTVPEDRGDRVGAGAQDRIQAVEGGKQPVSKGGRVVLGCRLEQRDQMGAILTCRRAWRIVPPIRISTCSIGQTIVIRS